MMVLLLIFLRNNEIRKNFQLKIRKVLCPKFHIRMNTQNCNFNSYYFLLNLSIGLDNRIFIPTKCKTSSAQITVTTVSKTTNDHRPTTLESHVTNHSKRWRFFFFWGGGETDQSKPEMNLLQTTNDYMFWINIHSAAIWPIATETTTLENHWPITVWAEAKNVIMYQRRHVHCLTFACDCPD